jgi:hypothetical protein
MPEQKKSGRKHPASTGKGKGKAPGPKNMTPRENEGQGLDREVGQFSGEGTPSLQKK